MKLLVVRTSEELAWHSCKSISRNLRRSYETISEYHQVTWYDLPQDTFRFNRPELFWQIEELCEFILKEKPDRLIFFDHLPLPPVILRLLGRYLSVDQIPPVLIHAYGDFTFFAQEWYEFLKVAQGVRIGILAASASQQRLLEYFLPKEVLTGYCHFPVSAEFQFESGLRKKYRDLYGVSAQERVLFYSGRINIQKNVDTLIAAFARFKTQNPNLPVQLWIAGNFDDSGIPFMGIKGQEGYLYSKIETQLGQLPESTRKSIRFLKWLDQKELLGALCAADLFASFSLYHDEDFGMAPAEALATGLPCVLTDWGGYSSFVSPNNEWVCQLIPTEVQELGCQLELRPFYQILQRICEEDMTDDTRTLFGTKFQKRFSAEAAALQIQQALEWDIPKFKEPNWKLQQFIKLVVGPAQHGLNEMFLPSTSGLYKDIYSHYISGIKTHE